MSNVQHMADKEKEDKTLGKQDLGAYIIGQVARSRGVTREKVRSELEKEIMRICHDGTARDKWNRIFGEDVIPTPEEFITRMELVLKGE